MKNYILIVLIITVCMSMLTGCESSSVSPSSTVSTVSDEPEDSIETMYKEKTITISNGTQVAYYEAGDPIKQTVIFVHGFTGSKDIVGQFSRQNSNDFIMN